MHQIKTSFLILKYTTTLVLLNLIPFSSSKSRDFLKVTFDRPYIEENHSPHTPSNGVVFIDSDDLHFEHLTNDSFIGIIDLGSDVLLLENLTRNEVSVLFDLKNDTFDDEELDNRILYEDYYEDSDTDPSPIFDFWPGQFILTILYTLAALLSLSLNIIAILVWFYGERPQSKEIWQLLVNLSVADIGMAMFCIPFTYTNVMLQRWIFPHALCPVVNFAQSYFVFVSVWTLTIISVDRYFAIVHPLYKCRYSKRSMLAVIWLVGSMFASSQLIVSRAQPYSPDNKLYECIEVWDKEIHGQIYSVIVFVATFLIPVLVITVAYSSIWYHMVHHVAPGNPDIVRDSHQMDVKNKVFKMLTMVVGLFLICWLPINLFNLIQDFVPSIRSAETNNIYLATFFVSHFLAMVHSLINPIIYCFMSENFRQNLLSMFPRYMNRFKRCDSESMVRAEMGIPATPEDGLFKNNTSSIRDKTIINTTTTATTITTSNTSQRTSKTSLTSSTRIKSPSSRSSR